MIRAPGDPWGKDGRRIIGPGYGGLQGKKAPGIRIPSFPSGAARKGNGSHARGDQASRRIYEFDPIIPNPYGICRDDSAIIAGHFDITDRKIGGKPGNSPGTTMPV